MFVLVTDYTLGKRMSANDQSIFAVTGRAHCQRQVAFFLFFIFLYLPHFAVDKFNEWSLGQQIYFCLFTECQTGRPLSYSLYVCEQFLCRVLILV